jgi:NMD protein affecting ribosome stability and mRNA decay
MDFLGPTPGRGWGCVVCGVPSDGAVAVLCDACVERKVQPIRIIEGDAAEHRRLVITPAMRERKFAHRVELHPELPTLNTER